MDIGEKESEVSNVSRPFFLCLNSYFEGVEGVTTWRNISLPTIPTKRESQDSESDSRSFRIALYVKRDNLLNCLINVIMTKLKRSVQVKEASAVKSINISAVKKQRNKRNDQGSSNDICKNKNDLKKLSTSNEVVKNTFASKENNKKKKRGNKFNVKNVEAADVPTKYAKDDKKTSEMGQKAQINMEGKTKRKMKNRDKLDARNIERLDVLTKYPRNNRETTETFQNVYGQINANSKAKGKKKGNGQDMNSGRLNKDVDAKKRRKKLQTPAKESIDFEHKRTRIEKLKKMSEKKKKRMLVEAEAQQMKSDKVLKLNKYMMKIRRLEEMLANKSQAKKALKDRIMIRLRMTRFKFINEMLYSNDSSYSKLCFKEDPEAFEAYQAGYKWQLEQWTVNPLDIIISSIKKLSTDNIIADFGCGEAQLSASVPHTVYSFDFIALNDRVKACDMAHTPLRTDSVHVVVFCLSLMGSDLGDYIKEANRVLKNNGILKIAEFKSRFDDVKEFIRLLRNYGFKNTWKDLSHDLFCFMDFKKEKNINMKRKTLPLITLKSFLYKKK